MAKFVGLILGICIFNAQCAVYRNADSQLHRVVRSPHYGSNHFEVGLPPPPPPPPPPPFLYHTHNWSGVARGAGGRAQGVFSGAAATAQSSFPGTNEAVSLAAADTSGGSNCDDDFGAKGLSTQNEVSSKSTQYSSNSFASGSGYDGQTGSLNIGRGFADRQSDHYNSDSSGFASNSAGSRARGFERQSGQYSSGASDAQQQQQQQQQQNNGFGEPGLGVNAGLSGSSGFEAGQGYKDSHLSSQNNDNNFGSRGRNAGLLNQGGFGANEQQSASKGFSSSQAQSSSFGSNSGIGSGSSQRNDFANQKLGSGSTANGPGVSRSQENFAAGNSGSFGHGYGHRRFESSNYHGRSQQLQNTGGGQSAGFNGDTNESQKELTSGGAGASANGEVQSTLNGALDLASQGLQAADKAGCSTCQKSSFALSNAKSWNGNAVSLAIGG